MNILYFGPFRHDNNFGLSARTIAQKLEQNHKTYLRNIFLNNPYDNMTVVNLDRNTIHKPISNYDYILEHCPIEMMHIDRGVGGKYACIPIIDQYGLTSKQVSILKQFDIVISDDALQQKLLEDNNIKCVPLAYDLYKEKNNELNINFSYHFFNKKFYFLGNFKEDHAVIQKIIISFILAFRNYNNVSLILVCSDTDQVAAEKSLSEMIDSIFKKLKYVNELPPIKVILQKLDYQKLHYLHKSCDILIDVHDSYKTGIDKQLARLYHKNIIDISNLDTVSVPFMDYKEDNETINKYSILTNSLIKAMTEIAKQQVTISDNHGRSIIDILC